MPCTKEDIGIRAGPQPLWNHDTNRPESARIVKSTGSVINSDVIVAQAPHFQYGLTTGPKMEIKFRTQKFPRPSDWPTPPVTGAGRV